ncbi:pilus assembly protein [Altererythrobacter aurantiacus]|uniref:Pilus assembly protein n=1 Tax=Parapontixanthobacter aurantiacus TaxID=1463599 RepID=A0A844ZDQ2_9SPHN|nr:TadE/TadG family type IV pilus assembly protein [Parapontixanthobacter aurantiacus]MXO86005.1 pilus assembly protein [Parapontixanthobacter aurantiacus]
MSSHCAIPHRSGGAFLSDFARDEHGASAAEFALVLPIFLLFLLGILDVGLYAWNFNQTEKATQMGTRWAVATDMVPSGLASYSFAVNGGIPQGTVVPKTAFGGVTCTSTGCTCVGQCATGLTPGFDSAAFTAIADRMRQFKGDIEDTDITIDYDWSGIGYAGDPNGPDVAPFVTVTVDGLDFQPISTLLFGADVGLPAVSHTLTAEDSQGTFAN